MKRKGLSICTLFAVLLLTVSFSLPVYAVQTTIGSGKVSTTLTGQTLYVKADQDWLYAYNLSGTLLSKADYFNGRSSMLTFDVEFSYRIPISTWYGGYYSIPSSADVLRIFLPFSTSSTTTFDKTSGFGSGYMSVKSAYVSIYGERYECVGSGSSWYLDSLYTLKDRSSFGSTTMDLHVICTVSCYFSASSGTTSSSGSMTVRPKLDVTFGTDEYTMWIMDNPGLSVTDTDIQNQTNSINNKIQQETQKQTDSLENGYDNSGLNQSNSNLSGAITDYDSTESQITDSSVANIDAAAFVSPASNATLLASISFCTSWLQSLFVNLGDWSLLVTVSLSLALGLMLIGWFKYR